jgi:hypothetical protein
VKLSLLVSFLLLSISSVAWTCTSVRAVDDAEQIQLRETANHHIVELNSNQPYVAGYHVETPDLGTRERVQATSITVSFLSTQSSYFESGTWLGAGMFVQGQDSKLFNVDYGFYTMMVLDSSDHFFLDIGLHQTRERTAPLQSATSDLIYAYTWEIDGVNPSDYVTLLASWDDYGFVHYSISVSGLNVTLPTVNVADRPMCESVIRQFYAGNANSGMMFPYSHFCQYFQFGVVSPRIIQNSYWLVDVKDPMILRKTGWQPAEIAWSTEGDISFIDADLKWGGRPYEGVSARYHLKPLQNLYELIFSYDGQTLPTGTVLWDARSLHSSQPVTSTAESSSSPVETWIQSIGALFSTIYLTIKSRWRKMVRSEWS